MENGAASGSVILNFSNAVLHMMKLFFTPWLLPLLMAALLSGCSAIPQPEVYPFSSQQKMQVAHHWDVLANDVANRINNELIRLGYLETPVYVEHICQQDDRPCAPATLSAFDAGFNDLLLTQLVAFGVPTLARPDSKELHLQYKVQTIFHANPRRQWPRPGALTALTSGIVVLRDAPWELISILASAAIDATRNTSVINGHYEVIISTSIAKDNVYLMRTSDIYYINDEDFWQFQQPTPAPSIELTSSHQ